MTFEEESRIAQQVLDQLASRGTAPTPRARGARGAQVDLLGVGYSVHRHGSDLRFNQRTGLRQGEVGRYLIVAVGEHSGGWMTARSVRPPGGYHDERAADAARRIVERVLAGLGYTVGTTGREGRQKTAREIDADIQEFLTQPPTTRPAARRPRKRRAQ